MWKFVSNLALLFLSTWVFGFIATSSVLKLLNAASDWKNVLGLLLLIVIAASYFCIVYGTMKRIFFSGWDSSKKELDNVQKEIDKRIEKKEANP